MRQQEVKVHLTLSEGYQERFTRACIKVAKRRTEGGNGGRGRRKDAKKLLRQYREGRFDYIKKPGADRQNQLPVMPFEDIVTPTKIISPEGGKVNEKTQ